MRNRPVVNYGLVAANVLIFMLGFNGMTEASSAKIDQWMLHTHAPQMYQFFTSVFLHAGWAHLIGNMIFLWVFGNAINDRLGNMGYLAFYLAGGVMACVGYILFSDGARVLGASGAISAVTGAFLVLLPKTRVTVLAIFFYILTPLEISSLFFLAFQLVFNLMMPLAPGAGGGVAYVAHSAGYIFGISVAAALLAGKLLPRDQFDLLNMISSFRRRSKYRRIARHGFDPFNPVNPAMRNGREKKVATRTVETTQPDTPKARIMTMRSEISQLINNGNLPSAASEYLKLVQLDEDAILPHNQQLDVANQLMSVNQHSAAADAYERFLTHYKKDENTADIHLMLGIIYGRYLKQSRLAEQNLKQAIDGLDDPSKIAMAKADLHALSKSGK